MAENEEILADDEREDIPPGAVSVQEALRGLMAPISEQYKKALENTVGVRREMLRPHFDISRYLPEVRHHIEPINIPTPEERNEYRSAGVLLQSLNRYYAGWAETVEPGFEVAVYAALASGGVIKVRKLIEEGFNGIAIEGDLAGQQCLLLLHQASLQFVCVAEKIEEKQAPRKVGFVYSSVPGPAEGERDID